MIDRMIGAARLNPKVYEEVEADTSATSQAALVVILVGVLGGLGSAVGLILFRADVLSTLPGGSLVGSIVVVLGQILTALLGWGVWALVTYVVGTSIFEGTADWGELLRALGFAQSPGILGVLKFMTYAEPSGLFGLLACIRFLGLLIGALVGLWMLLASLIGVRQALDFSTRKAVLTILIGWTIRIVLDVFVTFGNAGLFGLFG